jgi:DNA-directed RNA polymerase specialized sigma24 family protein
MSRDPAKRLIDAARQAEAALDRMGESIDSFRTQIRETLAETGSGELTAQEAADRLGMNRLTIQRYCAEGKLAGRQEPVPSGWRWMIPVSEIERLEKERA